jgi:hypothetical protein
VVRSKTYDWRWARRSQTMAGMEGRAGAQGPTRHAREFPRRDRRGFRSTGLPPLDAELADGRPLRHNAFKIELVRRTAVAVLGELAGENT